MVKPSTFKICPLQHIKVAQLMKGKPLDKMKWVENEILGMKEDIMTS